MNLVSYTIICVASYVTDPFDDRKRSHHSDEESDCTDSNSIPLWFTSFSQQHSRTMNQLVHVQERILTALDKQNDVLIDLKNFMLELSQPKSENMTTG